jgi:ABC-2 type transport system ATP-binding protein
MKHFPAVAVQHVTYRYRDRVALDDVSFDVPAGEIFGLLGPNGGGKSTLFRLLATASLLQDGWLNISGYDLKDNPFEVRQLIGVVFQSPSLDKKLTVFENLRHHARLYGMSRSEYVGRIDESLDRVGLLNRRADRVETLSGGLARRAEIAQSLLHRPGVLIMDEPSTGLDPAARSDLWRYLETLPAQGVTILLTTHLMEEAERCARVGILDRGKLVGLGRPADLRAEIGGEVVSIQSLHAEELARQLESRLSVAVHCHGSRVRFELPGGFPSLAGVLEVASGRMDSISVARPTLEDVFLKRTGHQFWGEAENG